MFRTVAVLRSTKILAW